LEVGRRLLLKFVAQRGWRVPPSRKVRIDPGDDFDRLAEWIRRVYSAHSLAEVLPD